MKNIYKNAAEKQAAYLQRKRAKQEAAAEQANEAAQYKRLNLCGFSEIAFETPAQTWLDEVQVHRSWLRALEQPDVQPGETLRELARRTWNSLLNDSTRLGVNISDGGVWYPCFQPSVQHFQIPFDSRRFPGGPLGERIHGAASPDWFDVHWKSPTDCSGDEPIDIKQLPPLPPIPSITPKKPEQKAKTEPRVQPTVTGYETSAEDQNRFSGFGTFGMTRASHL